MGLYKANATNTQNFSLTSENQTIGALTYKKWYSFDAEIKLYNGATYPLEQKGFWDSRIELKEDTKTLLELKMGWKGIIINTFFDNKESSYLLTHNGLLSSKFILTDTDKNELLVAQPDFKWNKFNSDYTIETTQTFDDFDKKELLLLTILHCINYYMAIIASGG